METNPVSETLRFVVNLSLALSNVPNGVGISFPHLRTATDPVSETSCFLVYVILDDGQSPETQQF
jgi:hypothetical protein